MKLNNSKTPESRASEAFDTVQEPFRYFIRSRMFMEQFSSITEADALDMIRSYCSRNKRGPLGQKELLLTDDNGEEHIFLFETFSNTHDVLTRITYVKPHAPLVVVPAAGRVYRN